MLLVLFFPVAVFYFSYSGRRKLFDIQVSKVQPSDADISPVAWQSAGLWSQLHQQRRCRQLCTGHVHGARHTEQLSFVDNYTHTHTHTCLKALFPGLPGWAGTRKVKPMWILLKLETVCGSGISWAASTPATHHSSFLQARCPSCHPTNSIKALVANSWVLSIISNRDITYDMHNVREISDWRHLCKRLCALKNCTAKFAAMN